MLFQLGRSVVYHTTASASTTSQDYRISKRYWNVLAFFLEPPNNIRIRRGLFYEMVKYLYLLVFVRANSAWLRDSDDPQIKMISLKARVLSNLTLDSAEELQVLSAHFNMFNHE